MHIPLLITFSFVFYYIAVSRSSPTVDRGIQESPSDSRRGHLLWWQTVQMCSCW